ncbi:MAG: aminotransferase class I/II-fold pyridoxal phosphate-dependent enzyme [Desulfobacterales bacterium]|jgi:dTDP-4-amino-4,6-dideoxygalactose transaminase
MLGFNSYLLPKNVVRFGLHQARNLVSWVLGSPLKTPPLVSGTLDYDDVRIAKKQIRSRHSWFSSETVKKYESKFASWNGSKFAFAFMGGRVALTACIHALELQEKDEVIVPGYTCVVVPNAFKIANVKVVYSDIELETFGLDASLLEKKFTSKTKAVVIHHLYGIVCRDYKKIISTCRKRGIYVIEDCAQAIGAEFRDQKVGNWGDVAIYSTEQSKAFTTIQGGIVTTNDSKIADRIKEYYNQAKYPSKKVIDKLLHSVLINYYSYKDPQRWWKKELIQTYYKDKILVSTTKEEENGGKPFFHDCKMASPLAEIGINQLTKIDRYNQKRRENALRWVNWCDTNGYQKPLIIKESIPIYLRYPVMVEPEKKQDISWAYRELGVSLGVWFLGNIHPTKIKVNDCPNANKAVRQCINFPTLE